MPGPPVAPRRVCGHSTDKPEGEPGGGTRTSRGRRLEEYQKVGREDQNRLEEVQKVGREDQNRLEEVQKVGREYQGGYVSPLILLIPSDTP